MDPEAANRSEPGNLDDWDRFSTQSRLEASVRNQKFLLLGSVLVLAFTTFDVFSETLSTVELRLRLINNGIVLVTLLALIGVLRTGWGRRAVFALLFAVAASVLAGQAYLLTEITEAPGRLAFHYLAVLGLTMAGIQWVWRWQLGLGAIAVALIAATVRTDHPDFGFYLLSLSGCAVLSTVFGHALVLLRFEQFLTSQRLSDLNDDNQQRRRELEALNDEMRDFAYAMSHDLRAPLINLDGFAQALGESFSEVDGLLTRSANGNGAPQKWTELREEMTESLFFIRQAASKMGRLISGILKLSRLDRSSCEIGDVDLHAVVDEVINSLRHQIDQREIAITVGQLPVIRGDRLRLSQLFGNLIDNSIKYMRPEGLATIEIDCRRSDGRDIFSVRDNGIGVQAADHDKVFRIFARSGNTQAPGDGIGLSAVKKIIDQHKGKIWIDPERSDLGRGTTVCFTLPTSPSLDRDPVHQEGARPAPSARP